MDTFTTPGGEELVILAKKDYEALLEQQDPRLIAEGMKSGAIPSVSHDLAKRLLFENPVKVWREVKGLDQRDLAAKAGVAQSTISKIENGHVTGTVSQLKAIATVLGIRVDDIV